VPDQPQPVTAQLEAPPAGAWLPAFVTEAAADDADVEAGAAWAHTLTRLTEAANRLASDPGAANSTDLAAGFRHLLVLLSVGIDGVLRDPAAGSLQVTPNAIDDARSWGMECPDCLYTGAAMRGGESYRLWGNRGTARYVGLQTMDGIASTANALVDELEVDTDGNFEVVLSPEPHEGNWLAIKGDHPNLVVRHFFYDWDSEIRSSLFLEPLNDAPAAPTHRAQRPITALSRQIAALGDFVLANLGFFIDFGRAAGPNQFLPPFDGTAMGAAAENRPVIGRWELTPQQALLLEVTPPEGVYWSLSIGNPWWETINYGDHQSSLNGHQAHLDDDGVFRAVISAQDPGIANWLDTAGHSNGPMILRCVRTVSAPTPTVTVLPFDDLHSHLPASTLRVSAAERVQVLAFRRRAVDTRFAR
jgi:hypothetical protein